MKRGCALVGSLSTSTVTGRRVASFQMPFLMASEAKQSSPSTWAVLSAGALATLAVLGTYLTVAWHPAFLPLLILPLFGLCHVLVYPKAAKRGFVGPPVIRYAMPEEFRCTVLVAKPQPDYQTIPVEKVQPPPPAAPVRPATHCAAYCAPIVPAFHAPPPVIAVM
ncbi:hypothetical protein V5799_024358 [Amblyomma americanum]|uniref:Uncharacterized protein n=1 Tax=Amblyomma americanum TaxID=6943 RepID=A0AAQ4ECS9_AMBAM